MGSGSSGNSIYIESGSVKLLIDAGLSYKETGVRLSAIGRDVANLNAILVTHEHIDHCRSLHVFGKRLKIPIYINEATFKALPEKVNKINIVNHFTTGTSFQIEDIFIEAFSIPHDAADPVGLTFRNDKAKIGLVTDLGFVTRLVHEKVKGCSTIIIESNHDPEMLNTGSYPWPVKQRIKGKFGHLSNDDCGEFLQGVCRKSLKNVVLAHISDTNNHSEVVKLTAQNSLSGTSINISLATQLKVGKLIVH